jgi:peptidoglycan/LPS O-acetylase OafA/YrhL
MNETSPPAEATKEPMTAAATSGTTESTGSDLHRPDIEGMRAIAVLLVLLYHAGIPAFSGGYVGVDVFFVISGFLITGLLVRELRATGTIDRSRFYARRIRRLLPATALVLSATAALTVMSLRSGGRTSPGTFDGAPYMQ